MTKNAEGKWEVTGKFVVDSEGSDQVTADDMTFTWGDGSVGLENNMRFVGYDYEREFFAFKFRSTGKIVFEKLENSLAESIAYVEAVSLNRDGEEIKINVVVQVEIIAGENHLGGRLLNPIEIADQWFQNKETSYEFLNGKNLSIMDFLTTPYRKNVFQSMLILLRVVDFLQKYCFFAVVPLRLLISHNMIV